MEKLQILHGKGRSGRFGTRKSGLCWMPLLRVFLLLHMLFDPLPHLVGGMCLERNKNWVQSSSIWMQSHHILHSLVGWLGDVAGLSVPCKIFF